MNLKLVVASMSILGLVSCPVFATTTVKKHQKVKPQAVAEYKDYKDMDTVPVCTITNNALSMTAMTQNVGRSLPNPCNPGWFERVQFSGGINVDVGKFGNRNTNYQGENYQRLSLNDAYLNMSASITDWAKAFASLSFSTPTTNANPGRFKSFGAAEYSAAYSNNINSGAANNVELEQAYATLGNSDVSPIFVQVGKQFQDFSRYEIHPISASMTQVMSQVLATSIKLGFITNGFHGGIFGFDDPINKVGNSSKPTNGGAALGYDYINDQLGWDVGAAYLYNMIGANDVAYSVVNFNKNGTGAQDGAYNSRVAAAAAYADLNSGPFTIGARYTTALERFNVADMPENGVADLAGDTIAGAPIAGASGAKPWSAGLQAGYGFDAWNKNQNVYLGYQTSREAAGMNLPKNRWLAGYGVEMFGKGTLIGIEWDHDSAYSDSDGGTGNNTNLVSLRSSVEFG